jgi:hypothetical protein
MYDDRPVAHAGSLRLTRGAATSSQQHDFNLPDIEAEPPGFRGGSRLWEALNLAAMLSIGVQFHQNGTRRGQRGETRVPQTMNPQGEAVRLVPREEDVVVLGAMHRRAVPYRSPGGESDDLV